MRGRPRTRRLRPYDRDVRVDEAAGPQEFLRRAEILLLADEARHNLALGIAATLAATPDYYPEADYWTVEHGGSVVAAALRTPPHNLVLARPARAGSLKPLIEAVGADMPGVTGALPEAQEFASAWVAAHGGTWAVSMRQLIHALREVRDDGDAPGRMRAASTADRELAIDWWLAFTAEAVHDTELDRKRAAHSVDHRLTAVDSGLVLWEVRGSVVALAGYGGPTPNGIRIGPVYTPPAERGRGYATALVAALSRQLLAGGREFCFLYTDLANPTANRIYARIGYAPICDSAEISFLPADEPGEGPAR